MVAPAIPPIVFASADIGKIMPWDERVAREGEPYTRTTFGSAAVVSGAQNAGIVGTIAMPTVGKSFWVEAVTVSVQSTTPIVAEVGIGGDAAGRFTGFLGQVIVGGNIGPVTIPVKRLIRNYSSTAVGSLVCRNATTAETIFSSLFFNGNLMTDDVDYNAPKTLMFVGDSRLNGVGPTKTANTWPEKVKAGILSASGSRARIVLMTNSGSTTSEHEAWRQAGRYVGVDPTAIFYDVCMNDAITGTSVATYRANVLAFWNWVKQRYATVPMIVMGVSPAENATTHANAENLRAEAASLVAAEANPRLSFINLATAFDRTNASFYATSDPAGSRVHPNDAGHAAIGASVNAQLVAQGIRL